MDRQKRDLERLRRYERILAPLRGRDRFSLAEAKQLCAEEQPGYVTRVVRQLEADGLLEAEGSGSRPSFAWTRRPDERTALGWVESKVLAPRVTRTPLQDRPRERLLAQGPAALRTAELLAILIRTGRPGESALQAAEKVAARFNGELSRLPEAGRGELQAISRAVSEPAWCQIMAGIELGRRVLHEVHERDGTPRNQRIRTTGDAIEYCRRTFGRLAEEAKREEFHIVSLDTKRRVLATHQISVGALDQSLVHPREVFRPALRDAASAIILVHNHPSGDPVPSRDDLHVTGRLEEAGGQLGIPVLDHLIVARHGVVSLREYRQGPER